MNRTIVITLLVTALLAGTAGCGGKNEKPGQTETQTPQVAVVTETSTGQTEPTETTMGTSGTQTSGEEDQTSQAPFEEQQVETVDQMEWVDTEATEAEGEDAIREIFTACGSIDKSEEEAARKVDYATRAAQFAACAAYKDYSEEDIPELKSRFLQYYNELTQNEKDNFDAAMKNGIIPLLDKAISEGNYESVKDRFEESGDDVMMIYLLKAPRIKTSWDSMKSAYLTMGK